MEVMYLDCPIKPENDKKNYSVFELPNGLLVLLVSDPNLYGEGEKSKAACALRIDVGYFSDPPDINGLAHLLGHMMFTESKRHETKTLKNITYDTYIKNGGGSTKVVTGPESTTFCFNICESCLDGVLELFTKPFVTPLRFHKKTLGIHLNAVESESLYFSLSDDMRRDQILAAIAFENHPCRVFGYMNLKKLNIKHDDLLTELYNFQTKHYSAHRMCLCLQAGLPLKTLEELTVKHFSAIPYRGSPPEPECTCTFNHTNSFGKEFYSNVYYVKSVSDTCKLELTWILPSVLQAYNSEAPRYLINVMQYRGPGSLFAYLRNRFWIQNMSAGFDSGLGNNSYFSLFTLRFHLTDNGLTRLNEILASIYSYIKLIKKSGPNEQFFLELKEVNDNSFQFRSELDSLENVTNLVEYLKYYPSKDILKGPNLFFEYNENAIWGILHRINSPAFNIMITSSNKFPEIIYNKREKWYRTEYAMEEIPKEWILLWKSENFIPEIYFPGSCKFLVKDFRILDMPKCSQFPRKIIDNEISEIWFKQDDKFLLPTAYMCFNFITPLSRMSKKNTVLTWLYSLLLKDQISVQLYPATFAGLFYKYHSTDEGFILMVNGYNQKLHLIVDIITMHMALLPETLNECQLDKFVQELRCSSYNSLLKPSELNKDIRQCIVNHEGISFLERYNMLKNINLNDIKEFASSLFQEIKIQGLFQGNLTEEIAYKVINSILRNLKCSSIANPILLKKQRTRQIPLGTNYIKCQSLKYDKTSVISNYYQIGPSTLRSVCILILFKAIIKKKLVNALCIREKLVHVVSFIVKLDNGILGYIITLQSNNNNMNAMDEMIENCRDEMIKFLEAMDPNDYKNIHESFIESKQITDRELADEVKRNWKEITEQDYIFDRRIKEIQCFRKIRKEDIIEFLTEAEKHLQKISIQVVGKKCSETRLGEEPCEVPSTINLKYIKSEEAIKNVAKFNEDLFVFPITKLSLDCP